MRRILVPLLVLAGTLDAQTVEQPTNPVRATRVPPAELLPDLKTYDYAAQIAAMQADSGGSAPVDAVSNKDTNLPTAPSGVPKDFHLKSDVPLTPTALEAVRVSEKWRTEDTAPAAGPDGRVLYSFGAGLPTVVCAPLRVCIIELQTGEKIEGDPQIGDSVRWHVSPSVYGTAEQATPMIVLKPQVPGLDTNLLITTDRRAYYIRLISKPEEYVARVAFQYPEDDNARRWQQHRIEQLKAEQQTKQTAELMPAMIAVEKMNFEYQVSGGNEHIRPVRVFDDGTKTYIQMPKELQHRDAPVLVVVGSDGKGEMTNYRVREQTYIVDRLFDRAQLVLGAGKKAQKVEIIREPRG